MALSRRENATPSATAPYVHALRRLLLVGAYAAVILTPLALIARVMKPGAHGPLVVFADALGFVGLSLLALQTAASGRLAIATRAFGLRSVLSVHRWAGKTVLALVILHVVVLVIDDPSRLALLDLRSAPPRARAGVLALLGMFILAGSSAWRRPLRLTYERWRGLHLACTALVISAAFAHVVWVDAYTSVPIVRWTVLTLVLAAGVMFFWTRVAMQYKSALKPYRVLAVRRERGSAVTIELAADEHDGLRFEPGQFARLRVARCLYGLTTTRSR